MQYMLGCIAGANELTCLLHVSPLMLSDFEADSFFL